MNPIFCTYFDEAFLDRGITLIESLKRHHPGTRPAVLCCDAVVGPALAECFGDGVRLVSLGELETAFPALLAVRDSRSRWEYLLTCRCHFVAWLLREGDAEGGLICLDGDFYCFGPLDSEGWGDVAITPHRFSTGLEGSERYGVFNAGFTFFRPSAHSQSIVRSWCERCLERCSIDPEAGSYTDQTYLNDWAGQTGVTVLDHRGINAAPWNLADSDVVLRGSVVTVDRDPLLLFHFHGLREVVPGSFLAGLPAYRAQWTPVLREAVYTPYLAHVLATRERLGMPASTLRLLPIDLPEDADPALKMVCQLATLYERAQQNLQEKDATILELSQACDERLRKVERLRADLFRTQRTSAGFWWRKLTGARP